MKDRGNTVYETSLAGAAFRMARRDKRSNGTAAPRATRAALPYQVKLPMVAETSTAAATEVVFARTGSVADTIERLVGAARVSIHAALYRFNNQRLARALQQAHARGAEIRLVIDRNKYEESQSTRRILAESPFPCRLTYGRDGAGSKMHHKFVLLDEMTVVTGSYNWTFASEEQNYENLLILRDPRLVATYREEFDVLWEIADDTSGSRAEAPSKHLSLPTS
ncbi:MAG: phospholipase D-like domain-containing protein [Terriglobia bacterium]